MFTTALAAAALSVPALLGGTTAPAPAVPVCEARDAAQVAAGGVCYSLADNLDALPAATGYLNPLTLPEDDERAGAPNQISAFYDCRVQDMQVCGVPLYDAAGALLAVVTVQYDAGMFVGAHQIDYIQHA